ncbi:MAG: L-threonine 3-dehydrogenase [Candidatus Methanoperedens sp.]|jgi:threonine 3-dehydrogenase|nr:L-threonine 3-dehydrogenase [Candidatus Methanoperedens sp.]
MNTMKAVRKMKEGVGLELVNIPIPEPAKHEVLVKVKACSMCGTDVHIYNWEHPWSGGRIIPPRTIGHEVCGIVEKTGSEVTLVKEGDLVSAESHIFDGNCTMCRSGNMHICENLKFFGVDVDGFFAEYAIIPEVNVWKNPPDMPYEIATLQESIGNSVYTVFSQDVTAKTVAVFGAGPTGLFATGLLKAAGAAKIIVVAGSTLHLDIARKMGADIVINRHESDTVSEIMEVTGGQGVDVFLEMSGSGAALNQGLKTLRPTGRASVLGLPTKEVCIDMSKDFVMKDITVRGIYGRKIWDTWVTTSKLLSSGRFDPSPVITHRIKLDDFETGFELMKKGEAGKVVMFP